MTNGYHELLARVRDGASPTDDEARQLTDFTELEPLLEVATALNDAGHGNVISYSRKVFIPLTQLCRDVCHYCTFAKPPRPGQRAYLTADELLAIARAGADAGCKEALFTLGDKPELRYKVAKRELAELGYETTIQYLAAMADLVFKETGLLPHANPGVMTREEVALLRTVSISQGIMLESASDRLLEKGGVHYGSPDKRPGVRLETMRHAGELQVPFTSGILIGIGETRAERIDALLSLRALHREHGHIQEIIVQNFRAKAGTKMADAPEPDLEDLLWTIAMARVVFGPEMNIQAPPNLSYDLYPRLISAGLNDWGGVSPVTPDHVNPEAPWPHLEQLRQNTAACGRELTERLAIYPAYALDGDRWLDEQLRTPVVRAIDADGFARTEDWAPGELADIPAAYRPLVAGEPSRPTGPVTARTQKILDQVESGESLSEAQIAALFRVRGSDFFAVCEAADALRERVNGNTVSYVVNRNINYTNVCYFKCQFCAFSKGKLSENLRGTPYDLDLDEVVRRTTEAWERGGTEVCMQGGIHPDYTGETYLEILNAVKEAQPDIHVHAFSPLEVSQGAETLGLPVREYLRRLKAAGLGTLPGTAAEVLDDEVRRTLCPDKLSTQEWLDVVEAAHLEGFRTTSTIMYGHIDGPVNWARHLMRLRELQQRTGGITEFVPLPFVHMEAPIYLKGKARQGPTFREAVLMHAVARLVLHPLITNIQVSWVKMGVDGVRACLNAGVNDMGGTLMNESISRAAGTLHGQELPPAAMEEIIRAAGRVPRQRSTLYGEPPTEQQVRSFGAPELLPIVLTPLKPRGRRREAVSSGA
ncbi:MAG: 5-amino-6-(D-ribitylamino)uracil--L-tyrosine 4-hydroxyphenyl transferase CofH [Dehalococcoidia bacterium]|nr:5-amino-6-(D-ribitylamino)uracil--L-tyrosine 4-hydroxyphenyl transferase CofH [Dehalococcoidia bacterium]